MPEPSGTDPNVLERLLDWAWGLILLLLGWLGWRSREDRRSLTVEGERMRESLSAKVDTATFEKTIERIEADRKERRERQEKQADEMLGELKALRGEVRDYHQDARAMVGRVHERIEETRRELDKKIERLRPTGSGDD